MLVILASPAVMTQHEKESILQEALLLNIAKTGSNLHL